MLKGNDINATTNATYEFLSSKCREIPTLIESGAS